MATEEVIKVEWEQLPQRSMWVSAASARNGSSQQRKRGAAGTAAPYAASAPAGTQAGGWEYLDHTADVQIHSWGADMGQAFGAAVVGMFGYMVELQEISDDLEIEVIIEGHDLESLLYNFMDECLYIFHTENFVMKEVLVGTLDMDKFKLSAIARGGTFDVARHSQGTEVKAITYSNMQIITDDEDKIETFVIVDI